MNKGVFAQNFKYHYKRYLSIFFASLGFACLVGAITDYFVENPNVNSMSLFATVWNYVILLVSFCCSLVGTIRRSGIVWSGILIYIFYLLWDFASYTFIGASRGIVLLSDGQWLLGTLFILYFLCAVGALVFGILLYVRIRQFLSRRYMSYVGLRTYALVFMIFVVVTYGILQPTITLLNQGNVSLLATLLEPLAVSFEALATFFVVIRLKSSY